jgi:hypothetical protein
VTRTARTVVSVAVVAGLSAATVLARTTAVQSLFAESPDDPVSIRHESVDGHGFFGSWTGRSHWGGGLHGGK